MLQIDDDAVGALGELGSIRISAEETDEGVELQIDEAPEPKDGDEVVEREGARVYLDPAAAEVLTDQILSVHAHGDHFHFDFGEQPA